jgi:hypothetical protein
MHPHIHAIFIHRYSPPNKENRLSQKEIDEVMEREKRVHDEAQRDADKWYDGETYMHTYIHACIHIFMHAYMHAGKERNVFMMKHKEMPTNGMQMMHYIHAYINSHTLIYACTHTHARIHKHIHAYIHTYIHKHAYIHTCMHTYMQSNQPRTWLTRNE